MILIDTSNKAIVVAPKEISPYFLANTKSLLPSLGNNCTNEASIRFRLLLLPRVGSTVTTMVNKREPFDDYSSGVTHARSSCSRAVRRGFFTSASGCHAGNQHFESARESSGAAHRAERSDFGFGLRCA